MQAHVASRNYKSWWDLPNREFSKTRIAVQAEEERTSNLAPCRSLASALAAISWRFLSSSLSRVFLIEEIQEIQNTLRSTPGPSVRKGGTYGARQRRFF